MEWNELHTKGEIDRDDLTDDQVVYYLLASHMAKQDPLTKLMFAVISVGSGEPEEVDRIKETFSKKTRLAEYLQGFISLRAATTLVMIGMEEM